MPLLRLCRSKSLNKSSKNGRLKHPQFLFAGFLQLSLKFRIRLSRCSVSLLDTLLLRLWSAYISGVACVRKLSSYRWK